MKELGLSAGPRSTVRGVPQLPIPRPVSDAPVVRAFCERLVPGEIAQFVNVDPPPWAKADNCTENVARVIRELRRGRVEYGWQLWETLPGVMIEAEFHAVWVDVDERRHDVTPKPFDLDSIVFLPAPNLTYEGKQKDNVRIALQDDPLIDDFINAAADLFVVLNRGELANYHGPIKPTSEMKIIARRRDQLLSQIVEKYFPQPGQEAA